MIVNRKHFDLRAKCIIEKLSIETPGRIAVEFHTVSDVVNAHIFANLPIDELAKLSGLSVTSFKTEFNKTFKAPPGHYIRKGKIGRARNY